MMKYNFGQMDNMRVFQKLHPGSPILDYYFKHLGPNVFYICTCMQAYINDSTAKDFKVSLITSELLSKNVCNLCSLPRPLLPVTHTYTQLVSLFLTYSMVKGYKYPLLTAYRTCYLIPQFTIHFSSLHIFNKETSS